MRPMYILLALIAMRCMVKGQNLVPNPSFEQYSNCPDNVQQIDFAVPWFQPNTCCGVGGSTDYYNACSDTIVGVPINLGGFYQAHSGVAYAGLSPFFFFGCNGREYLQVKLLSPLSSGVDYYCEFYVIPALNIATYVIDRIGLHFSNSVLSYYSMEWAPIVVVPQIENTGGSIIQSVSEWTKISGRFTALGGEEYLTIGNFFSDDQTIIDTLFPLGSNESGSAYYFN